MPPAARLGDIHICPMQTPAVVPIPHVGGPIMGPGVPNVMIEGMPAAVAGDVCLCVGPPSAIMKGSAGVLIAGRAAARVGDPTMHGGNILPPGAPTVIIGEMGSGNAKSVVAQVAEGGRDEASSGSAAQKTWIEIQMNDRAGFGVANTKFKLETTDGQTIHGVTDGNGLARVEGIEPGNHKITFPDLPQDGFAKKS
ncbi:MAG TPA: PAAR domain-containing protein [Gemmatimonadaceae bacterium]|nr:PAAR domain-containing protein [Gemmatimonadaceae bacterium]